MLSEEVLNASLDDGNAAVEAKGLRTPGGLTYQHDART